MSDRIDELVALIRPLLYPYGVADNSLTELATIAREAEARALKAEAVCEWLADIAASHAVAANLLREDETRDEYKARLLKAASEAVKS